MWLANRSAEQWAAFAALGSLVAAAVTVGWTFYVRHKDSEDRRHIQRDNVFAWGSSPRTWCLTVDA